MLETCVFGRVCIAAALICSTVQSAVAEQRGDETAGGDAWRSALYPEDWRPGYSDEAGRFLHDFSYAGYAMGERPIPRRDDVVRVFAPTEGDGDDTERIQRALDEAGEAGGGVVVLGAGVYRVAPADGSSAALRIGHSNVVLRGAGPGETVLINTEPVMRHRHVILVAPPNGTGRVWMRPVGSEVVFAEDAPSRAERVRLSEPADLSPGDWVVLRQDVTEAFIAEHDMTGLWTTGLPGPAFYRRVAGVEEDGHVVRVDVPLRYPLLVRDGARLHRVVEHLEQVGVEDLSIGMVENTTGGFGAQQHREEGTGAYEVHGSHALTMSHVVNGWVRNVHTARPRENTSDVHIVSNGVLLTMSRNVTVEGCEVRKPQYRGGGGNGYGITFQSSECLVTRCRVTHGRHNYSFKSMWTSGNVVHRSRAEDAMLASDFHMHLSPANLFDCVTVNRDWLEARYRPWGTIIHGHPTTQSVFWNTRGEAYHPRSGNVVVDSRQFGWGLVIGTRGPAHGVRTRPTGVGGSGDVPGRDTAPEDFTEGVGRGDSLEPESLYEDQLRRRLDLTGNGQFGDGRAG